MTYHLATSISALRLFRDRPMDSLRGMPAFAPEDGTGEGDASAGKPSDDAAKLLKEVMALKGQVKAAKEQLAAFGGRDRAHYDALIANAETVAASRRQAEESSLIAAGKWDEVRAQIVADHQRENKALQDQIAALTAADAELKDANNKLIVGRAFSSSAAITETVFTPAKAQKLYSEFFDVEDGAVVPYDAPRGATERTQLVDGIGQPIAFDAAIRRLIANDPEADQLVRAKRSGGKAGTIAEGKTTPASIGSGANRIGAALASGELRRHGVDGIPERAPLVPPHDPKAIRKPSQTKRDFMPGDGYGADVAGMHISDALAGGAIPAILPRAARPSAR